jgi:hypothetical protein
MKKSMELIEAPIDIVGGSTFGRYAKISNSQTWNMIISDDWLVPYAGSKLIKNIGNIGQGRGLFNSVRGEIMIAVVFNVVYAIDKNFAYRVIGNINTFSGEVFMDENDAKMIAICDKKDIWIYNYSTGTFLIAKNSASQPLDFTPNYVTFQDGYFIAADANNPAWRLSDINMASGPYFPVLDKGTLQTKPDNCVACVKIPGRGNNLLVMGKTVCEMWQNVGYYLFPYQRSSGFNIDYGCVNPATIAYGGNFICWIGSNEKSSPVILYSKGGDVEQISTDGINFKLNQVKHPNESFAMMFKQDGHLIYQFSFTHKEDNFTLAYDFNTQKFSNLSDSDQSYHPARRIVSFGSSYYYISAKDAGLYEINSKYDTQNGAHVPRIRITSNFRLPDSSSFSVNNIVFTTEQGISKEPQYLDYSISTDGGSTYGNTVRYKFNNLGNRQNRLNFWVNCRCNEFSLQLRMWGADRFLLTSGIMSYFQ